MKFPSKLRYATLSSWSLKNSTKYCEHVHENKVDVARKLFSHYIALSIIFKFVRSTHPVVLVGIC